MNKEFLWIIDNKSESQDQSYKISLIKSMNADNTIIIIPESEILLLDGTKLPFPGFSKLKKDFSPAHIHINGLAWGTEVFDAVEKIKASHIGTDVFISCDSRIDKKDGDLSNDSRVDKKDGDLSSDSRIDKKDGDLSCDSRIDKKDSNLLNSDNFTKILQIIDLLIINKDFLEVFSGKKITDMIEVENAVNVLIGVGGTAGFAELAVIVKDCRIENGIKSSFYKDNNRKNWLNVHVGDSEKENSVFSTAVSVLKYQGYDTLDAVVIATAFEQQYLANGSLDSWPEQQAYLPYLIPDSSLNQQVYSFPDCGPGKLGFYPVVDSFEWVERLLKLDVKTIQLRIKDKTGIELENEIRKTVAASEKYKCRLFINDYWELAIKHRAYGVHLGQEDLAEADLDKIEKSGLRLGLSTHCYREVARALAINPSYIAIGPVFETKLKKMDFLPQGVDALKRWVRSLNYPLVAIGGITLERGPEIISAGADAVAVVRDVTLNSDPDKRVEEWLSLIDNYS